MRLTLVTLVAISVTSLFAQNKDSPVDRIFQYSELGLNDFVVTKVDSVTKEEQYSKALNWIKEIYKNPSSYSEFATPNLYLSINSWHEKLETLTKRDYFSILIAQGFLALRSERRFIGSRVPLKRKLTFAYSHFNESTGLTIAARNER